MTTTSRPDTPVPARAARRAVVVLPAWASPAGVAALVTGATVALALRSPHAQGSWGICPSVLLTGLWCPACGGLRAVHDLTQGDVAGAMSMNPAVVLGLPVVVAVWAWWLLGTLDRRPRTGPLAAVGRLVSPRAGWVFLVLAVAFAVLRNLPGFEVLAPV